jgi:hypothetical protein
MTTQFDRDAEFWQLAEPFLARPGVTRSTMMGFPCLRLEGDFFGSWDPGAKQLVVKLDQITVQALLDTGDVLAFAPAGRPFREWVAVPAVDRERWPMLLEDAYRHAIRRQARSASSPSNPAD